MANAAGFYKNDVELLFSDTTVAFPDGTAIRFDMHETYTYPVNDWYFFNDETTAREFFGLPVSGSAP